MGFNRRPELLEELLSLMSREQHPDEVRKLSWFNPIYSKAPHSHLFPPPQWDGGENQKGKVQKLLG